MTYIDNGYVNLEDNMTISNEEYWDMLAEFNSSVINLPDVYDRNNFTVAL